MITDDLGLSHENRSRLEELLLEFERTWSPASISQAIEQLILEPADYCQIAVIELIKIDISRHWAAGEEKKIESYQSVLESIGLAQIPSSLILAEFLARHDAGRSPAAKEIRQRFPEQFGEFRKLFEAEKARRSGMDKVQASISTDAGKLVADTHPDAGSGQHTLPENFGRYKILRQLGAGAMGAVYLARDTQLDRDVALKTPSFGAAGTAELVERFYREARAAANLRHPNICPVYDVGEIDGRHYITMAYIDGRPLSTYIGEKPLDQKAVATIVRKLGLALAEAHAVGVIHRDLKPANIMVDSRRQPLVMDFGLARREDEMQSRMTQSGAILGTPAYMPPEQVKGQIEEIGPQADVYSLGIILYELLTGKLPFEGSVAAVIGQILTEQPAPPGQWRSDLDPGLEAICLKMLAKERVDRYASMKDVADDLGNYLAGAQPSAVAASPVVGQPWDVLELPDVAPAPVAPQPTQAVVGKAKTQAAFWKSKRGLVAILGGGVVAAALLALAITVIFRTPYGTLTITADDPNLVVEVDGRQINVRDGSHRLKKGEHLLALRIGDASLPIGSSIPFEIVGREGQYRLSTRHGDTDLRSNRFVISKGNNPALTISLTRVAEVASNEAASPAITLPPITGLELIDTRQRGGHGAKWLAYSPDSRTFASGANDKTVRIWNVRINEVLATLNGHGEPVRRVVFDSGGRRLASCDGNTILLWDVDEQRKIGELSAPGVMSFAFSPDSANLAWGGQDGKVRIVGVENLTEQNVFDAHDDELACVAYSPDGRTLATSSKDQTIVLWDVGKGYVHCATLRGHEQWPIFVAFSPDGSTLASSGVDKTIKLWDVATGERKLSIPANTSWILSLSFSPDGKVVAGGGVDRRISLWDTEKGELIAQTPRGNNNVLASFFSPDGASMVSCTTGYEIMTWKVLRGEPAPERVTESSAKGPAASNASETGQPPELTESAASAVVLWTNPVEVGAPIDLASDRADRLAISADGLAAYFGRGRDIWTATRADANVPFDEPVKLGFCTDAHEGAPALSADGLHLVFDSNDRPGGVGGWDIWIASRDSTTEPFDSPRPLGPNVNTIADEGAATITADGLTLLFHRSSERRPNLVEIWQCTRTSIDEPFGPAKKLAVNAPGRYVTGDPTISADGLTLIFGSNRPGAEGGSDLWMATRPTIDAPFGAIGHLGPDINNPGAQLKPSLSPDGQVLFYLTNTSGKSGDRQLMMVRRAAAMPAGNEAPAAPPVASADGWIDVIPLIDPARDKFDLLSGGANDWYVSGGELNVRPDDKAAKLLFPLLLEGQSLEWEITFTRTAGTFFTTDIPATSGFVPVGIRDDDSVFEVVVGPSKADAIIQTRQQNEPPRQRTVRILVQRESGQDRIEVFIDGQSIGHWVGDRQTVAKPPQLSENYRTDNRTGLFVAGNTAYTFHRIRLRMLDGQVQALDETVLTSATSSAPESWSNDGGWIELSNGRDLDGWVTYRTGLPVTGWVVRDGAIHMPSKGAGDIMTQQQFDNFELEFQWKISQGGNSGVFYRADGSDQAPQLTGLEYQLLDDTLNRQVKPEHLSASIYEIVAPRPERAQTLEPVVAGRWNTGRIIARGNHIEHWLNGQKVASVEIGGREWTRALGSSKSSSGTATVGSRPSGHIVLQDHNSPVWLRSIRLRPVPD